MTRKIAHVLVAGVVAAAALTGCSAAGSSAGSGSPSATRSAEEGAAPSDGVTSEGAPAAAGCAGELITDLPPIEVEVRLVGGQVEPSPDRVEVPLGTTVVLRAEADAPAEIHVHGYDVAAEAAPGEPACLEVLADTPGVYDVEAHPETLLLQLAVQ